ncbi:MAG: SAM-dependent methyltransferase [Rhodoferax sp.]|nr:MAG: SAM-dependent methyltransferase [Rhodoferax sp.]
MQALLDAIATLEHGPDVRRIFHGRGGRYPGCEHLLLDAYPPVWVLTAFEPLDDAQLQAVHAALAQRQQQLAPEQPLSWVYQCRAKGAQETRLMAGEVPEPHVVQEDGTRYRVHVLRGQNHGFFPDMAEGRRWVRSYIPSVQRARVLNLFAYTCAFSVVAMQAGARQVTNVDMSHGALAIGQQNHQLNGINQGAGFLAHDLFSTWGKVSRAGPYDLIVVDPPSYQKGSFIATKDYGKVMRRLTDLLMPGGHVLLCLNAPELGTDFLRGQMAELAPQLEFVHRLPNPPVFADVDEERALKVLLYRSTEALP